MEAVRIVFEQTTVSDTARELAGRCGRNEVDEMDVYEKIRLMQHATNIGREELTCAIIAMLPVELRLAAALHYEQVAMP